MSAFSRSDCIRVSSALGGLPRASTMSGGKSFLTYFEYPLYVLPLVVSAAKNKWRIIGVARGATPFVDCGNLVAGWLGVDGPKLLAEKPEPTGAQPWNILDNLIDSVGRVTAAWLPRDSLSAVARLRKLQSQDLDVSKLIGVMEIVRRNRQSNSNSVYFRARVKECGVVLRRGDFESSVQSISSEIMDMVISSCGRRVDSGSVASYLGALGRATRWHLTKIVQRICAKILAGHGVRTMSRRLIILDDGVGSGVTRALMHILGAALGYTLEEQTFVSIRRTAPGIPFLSGEFEFQENDPYSYSASSQRIGPSKVHRSASWRVSAPTVKFGDRISQLDPFWAWVVTGLLSSGQRIEGNAFDLLAFVLGTDEALRLRTLRTHIATHRNDLSLGFDPFIEAATARRRFDFERSMSSVKNFFLTNRGLAKGLETDLIGELCFGRKFGEFAAKFYAYAEVGN